MLIRHADPEQDAAKALALYTPYVTDSVASFEDSPPTLIEFATRMRHHIRTHAYLVAVTGDDQIAGFAYGGPYRERLAYRWTCEASIYLDAGYHRRGIGRALYSALFDLLERRGYRTVMAGITVPNEASIGLHHHCGFVDAGSFPHNGFKHGAWREVAWLTRNLGDPDAPPPDVIGPPVYLPAPIRLP